MVLVVMGQVDQVQRRDPAAAEQIRGQFLVRPGVHQGRLPLGGSDQDRVALTDVEELDRRYASPRTGGSWAAAGIDDRARPRMRANRARRVTT
jgi:hypothetical protein